MRAETAASREERKVVTVLFADLVGFTSRSERLDPEDVRALLSRYYARLRSELERFGGTVEKFIGDAVMALQLLAWTLTALGRGRELIDVLPLQADVPWVRAAEAFAVGDVGRAADICAAVGARTEEARDRLWLAEALIEPDRRAEAGSELERALSFYRSVGATRYVHQGEALMAADARQRGRA